MNPMIFRRITFSYFDTLHFLHPYLLFLLSFFFPHLFQLSLLRPTQLTGNVLHQRHGYSFDGVEFAPRVSGVDESRSAVLRSFSRGVKVTPDGGCTMRQEKSGATGVIIGVKVGVVIDGIQGCFFIQ